MTPRRWLYVGLLLVGLLLGAYLLGRWDLPLWGAAGWALGARRFDEPLPEPAGEREDRRLEVAREAAEGSSGVEDLAERHGLPVLSGRVGGPDDDDPDGMKALYQRYLRETGRDR